MEADFLSFSLALSPSLALALPLASAASPGVLGY